MERVEITRPIITDAGLMGLAMMQVCAVDDATDEEILLACNRDNPAGTSNGWCEVVRVADESSPYKTENKLPVDCEDHTGRKHFVVLC